MANNFSAVEFDSQVSPVMEKAYWANVTQKIANEAGRITVVQVLKITLN